MQPRRLDRLYRGSVLLTVFLYSAGYATAGLLLVLLTMVIDGVVSLRLPWRRTRLDILIVLFVGIFLLSGYLSAFPSMAIVSTGLAALTIYLAFGALSRIMRDDAGFLRPLLWAWAGGGVLAAMWATLRHLQSGLPASTPALGQNAIGTTMVAAMVIGFGLAVAGRGWLRYAAAGITVLTAVALLFSYTRGAWVGALAAFALLAGFGGRRGAAAVLTFALLIVLGGAIAAGEERAALVTRAGTILSASVNRDRIYLFRSAAAIFRDHPLLGTGMNTFPYMYPSYRLPGDTNPLNATNAHNIFLNMAAEGGVLGLGVFLAILVQTLRLGFRWRNMVAGSDERVVRTALVAALVGILVHQLFDGTLISVHLGAGMWMLMAMLTSSRSSDA